MNPILQEARRLAAAMSGRSRAELVAEFGAMLGVQPHGVQAMTLSHAWEVTTDDVTAVLVAHGLIADQTIMDRCEVLMMEHADRIEKAALWYEDMDDQTASALDEIENVLIENNVVTVPKRFTAPAKWS